MHLALQLEQFWNVCIGMLGTLLSISKRLNDAKSWFNATKYEMLGCILLMEHWYLYLVGRAFDVLTDHAPS